MDGTLPYTIAMKVCKDGEECNEDILACGVTLPAYARKKFYAAKDGQTSVVIDVVKKAAKVSDLGTFDMPLPADVKTGEEIELIFTAGLNGLLICSCKCRGSMVEKTIDF